MVDISSTPARTGSFCRRTRREFLWEAGAGFTGLALTGLLSQDGFFDQRRRRRDGRTSSPTRSRRSRRTLPAKAKSVIFLFMYGGPSQVDTFDYKPKLYDLDGQTIPVKTFGRGGKKNEGRVVGPKWKFKQYGQCGKWVSDLFPHLATCVDDIAFLHSMTADSPIHGSAMLQMNTGKILSGSPCLGSWVNYGLGSVNENLPGFVVMLDPTGGPISGAKNWSSGYMPATYQGTILRSAGDPILDLDRPDGHERGRPAPRARHARRVQRRLTWPTAPTTATWRPASPATSWPSDAALRPRGGRSEPGTGSRQALVRLGRSEDAGLRPPLPAGPAAGRARRALHPALLRRRPQRRQLGRPRRPGAEPQLPRRPHRQADRRPDQGPEAARPARRNADRLGRRVRPAADRRVRQGHRPRPQRLRLHDVDGRRRHQGRRQRRRRPTNSARRRWTTASTSSTCTPRSCTSWASTRTG